MSEVVDGEIVEDEGESPSNDRPARLSMTTIGGLQIRRPQESLPHLNLMIYGDSGAGKTLLSGTAAFVPELTPVLFVDVEGGTLTLSHFEDTADIDVVRVTEWNSMQKVYDQLYGGKHPYKTVVIDSLTEMQKLAMASQLGYGKSIDPGGSIPEFKDWGINTEQMRRLVRAFRDLPMNTIFTALSMDVPMPRNPAIEIKKPMFTKKLANEIPAFFDILFYLYVKERKDQANLRLVQTDKSDRVVAKCRVQGVPPIIENPTMDSLYDMLIRNPHRPVNGQIEVVQKATANAPKMMRRK